jgi:hypothetical protein
MDYETPAIESREAIEGMLNHGGWHPGGGS